MVRSNGFGLRKYIGVLMIATFVVGDILACQVPVFRYALERWNPDQYQLWVLSKGPLPDEASDWLEPSASEVAIASNVQLERIDVSESNDPLVQQIWAEHSAADSTPLLVSFYPKRFTNSQRTVAIEKLTEGSLKALTDSPARREIIKRLTEGHSAVWVLLKSGDTDKDTKALDTLEKQLARDGQRLELPTAEELEIDDSVLGKTNVPLQIKFSVLEVDRGDPNERFLIDYLIGSEADLEEYENEPIAFPVFGRGIVLYALVGAGISDDVIAAASKFIVGPCSCQVKEQNPGFDLLLQCDWDAAVGSSLISSPIPTSDAEPRLLTIPPGKAKK